MRSSLRLSATGLLAFAVVLHISPGIGNVLKYKLETTNYIRVKPNLTQTILRINQDIYMQPRIFDPTSYDVNIRNTRITIENENTTTNLGPCLSYVMAEMSLLNPFLAVYDSNGLLQYIKVHRSERDVSTNLKLLISGLLQVNRTILNGSSESLNSSELSLLGTCSSFYEVRKNNASIADDLQITKSFNMSSCSEIRNHNGNESACPANVCNVGDEREFKSEAKAELRVKPANESNLIEYVALDERVQFKPWKNSSAEVSIEISTKIGLVSHENELAFVLPSIDVTTTKVTSMQKRKISRTICQRKRPGNREDLRTAYKALACDAVAQNVHLDLYEKAIACWNI